MSDLLKETLAAIEKQYLQSVLKKCSGNIGRCASHCGLSRRSISSKLAQYGIDKSLFKGNDG